MQKELSHAPIDHKADSGIVVTGDDLEDLFNAEPKIVSGFKMVKANPGHLEAVLDTAAFQTDYHKFITEIKAVTYHQIEVKPPGVIKG